jgi:hypothetical protein
MRVLGLHRSVSPDAVSASHVAPMIVVAAIVRIKVPITNAILGLPTSAALVALILPQIRAKLATSLAKQRRSV